MVHTTINVIQSAEYRLCDDRAVGLPSSNLKDCRIAGRALTKGSMRTPAVEICDIGRNGSTQLVVGEDDRTLASIPPLDSLTAFPALAGCDAKLTRDDPGTLPSMWWVACRQGSSGGCLAPFPLRRDLSPASMPWRALFLSNGLNVARRMLRHGYRPSGVVLASPPKATSASWKRQR